MPKVRKRAKGAPKSTARNVKRKFRIGTRKAGISAHGMTTEALKEVLTDPNKKRYIEKVKQVLGMRGVTV